MNNATASDLWYTPRQQRLLKERFYRWVLNAGTTDRPNWGQAARQLGKRTGIDIPAETLRQNFAPVSKKQGKARRSFTDMARFRALHLFLTDDSVGYLKDTQLFVENDVAPAIALTLDEYLNPLNNMDNEKTQEDVKTLAALTGRFITTLHHADCTEEIVFDIDYDDPGTLVHITAHHAFETGDAHESVTQTYTGWVMGHASGFIVAILQSSPAGYKQDHRWYSLLQTIPSFASGTPFDAIALFEYSGALGGTLGSQTSFVEEGVSMTKKHGEQAHGRTERIVDQPNVSRHILVLTRT